MMAEGGILTPGSDDILVFSSSSSSENLEISATRYGSNRVPVSVTNSGTLVTSVSSRRNSCKRSKATSSKISIKYNNQNGFAFRFFRTGIT